MNKTGLYVLVAAIIILLLVSEIAVLAYFSHDSWYNRIGFILQIIGFYGIGLGFVQKSDVLKNFGGFDDMTSPDPVRFMIGNFIFLSIFSSILAIGLNKYRSQQSSMALGCLGQLLIICMFPFLFLYFVVHLIVICPFVYLGYVFSSALVESIIGASGDFVLKKETPGQESQRLAVKEIVASNPVATKSFLIGIPAAVLGFITKGIGLFF